MESSTILIGTLTFLAIVMLAAAIKADWLTAILTILPALWLGWLLNSLSRIVRDIRSNSDKIPVD